MSKRKKRHSRHTGDTAHVSMMRSERRLDPPRERLDDGCARILPTTVDGIDWRAELMEEGEP